MRSTTYIKNILIKFGGNNSRELRDMLLKLRDITIKEYYIDESDVIIDKQQQNNDEIIKISDIENISISEHIKKIMESNCVNYSKALKLMKLFKLKGGWHHIKLIPCEIFHSLWTMFEMSKNIEFDENRDYQYFKVF